MNRNSRRGMYLDDDVNVTMNPNYDLEQEDLDQSKQPSQRAYADQSDSKNVSKK